MSSVLFLERCSAAEGKEACQLSSEDALGGSVHRSSVRPGFIRSTGSAVQV